MEERGRGICFPDRVLGCTFCSIDDNDIVLRSRFQELEPASFLNDDDEEEDDDRTSRPADVDIFTTVTVLSDQRNPSTSSSARGSNNATSDQHRVHQHILALDTVFAKEGWEVELLHDNHYNINGRDCCVFLLPQGVPPPSCRGVERRLDRPVAQFASRLMVSDGPLLQPLLDYLLQTGLNEHYDARGTENPAAVTGMARSMEFNLNGKTPNDRVQAMVEATMQAEVRRQMSTKQTPRQATPTRVAPPAASRAQVAVAPANVSVVRKFPA